MKKVKKGFLPTRRQVIRAGLIAGAGMMMPWRFLPAKVFAAAAIPGLSDPALQPKFMNMVPDAMAPSFKFTSPNNKYQIEMRQNIQMTGLLGPGNIPVPTTIWGYGTNGKNATWPGRTFEVQSGTPIEVMWKNKLPNYHLLPVDTSLHWAYSLYGYTHYTIAKDGVPVVTHLHGGHSDFQFDGNPEFFFGPGWKVRGPQWVEKKYIYHNSQVAGNLWYHDHALGITRLNVYAGLAGFYFVRDNYDTGKPGNPLDLPAWPYEKAYAIQDRMFRNTGELFYPAFPGEPAYEDFITGEGAILPEALFPNGGPTALAEFFGDHMVVNGVIWPKENVEPRNYRLHLLNGTDSRFMAIQFFEVSAGATDFTSVVAGPLEFTVIGSDQGLASSPTTVTTLLSEPGSRYDIIFDFKRVTPGSRVIMKNIGGDEPFGGEFGEQIFDCTDRIMAFDVVLPLDTAVQKDVSPTLNEINFGPNVPVPTRIRKVALFEGKDEFGRLQPLLGTAEPAIDYADNPINWPATDVYKMAMLPDGTPSPLEGPMEGSIAWHSPTTENPALNTTEEWEIWNMTGDAHPIHLHLVHFEVLGRQEINFDSNADEDGFIEGTPANDGIYLVPQPTVQHNSVAGEAATYGMGFKIVHPTDPDDAYGAFVNTPPGIVENTPKDMVTALPGQITRIKATFDKPGHYVWHCHILSHEDHEMMRVMHVGPGA
jgi:FtsP/CotA-like multicopper oxidase with cupredoxin domain